MKEEKNTKNFRAWIKQGIQFAKFCLVGVSNTVISYIVYLILIYFGVQYVVANLIGYFVSILNAFYWNNKYVFKEERKKRNVLAAFWKTVCSYSFVGLIVDNALLFLQVSILHIPKEIAPIIGLIVTTPINYLMNKLWAFNDRTKRK